MCTPRPVAIVGYGSGTAARASAGHRRATATPAVMPAARPNTVVQASFATAQDLLLTHRQAQRAQDRDGRHDRSWPRPTVTRVRRASSPQPKAPSHQARTAVASTVRPAASAAVSIRALAGRRWRRDPAADSGSALPTHRSAGGATTSWSWRRAWCTACRSIRTADFVRRSRHRRHDGGHAGAEPLVGAVQRDLENVADVEVEAPGGGRREDDGQAGTGRESLVRTTG